MNSQVRSHLSHGVWICSDTAHLAATRNHWQSVKLVIHQLVRCLLAWVAGADCGEGASGLGRTPLQTSPAFPLGAYLSEGGGTGPIMPIRHLTQDGSALTPPGFDDAGTGR